MKDDNQSTARNVSAKDIVLFFLVISLLIPLFWYQESGDIWAAYLIALVSIIGLAYWIHLTAEKRKQAEIKAKEELDKSALARGIKYLILAIYLFVAFLIIKSLTEWMKSF